MRTRFFALAAALVFALAPAAHAGGVKASADWASLRAITPGERVTVRLKDGDRLKGRFESASETDINFTEDGRRVTLRRDSVGRVEVARGKKRWQGALVGAGIGGGVGTAGGGYLVARGANVPALVGGSFVGAGVGAAVGAALGLGTNYETVYEAQ